jgi:hypothetical protein
MAINACIVSFFMDNIDRETVELQKAVVDKFNVSKYPYYVIKTDAKHGATIDYFWGMNGVKVDSFRNANIEKKVDHDVVLFMDIDCIPLSDKAIDLYVQKASEGRVVGNAQRTNHLQNNQHVYAAPSAHAISLETFLTIGKPSALETGRSDCIEEYTWAAQKAGVPVDLYMPLKYEEPPIRYEWEKDYKPYWPLADGMPVYGMGTTYGDEERNELFYHQFQIRIEGQQEKFQNKCRSILIKDVI